MRVVTPLSMRFSILGLLVVLGCIALLAGIFAWLLLLPSPSQVAGGTLPVGAEWEDAEAAGIPLSMCFLARNELPTRPGGGPELRP